MKYLNKHFDAVIATPCCGKSYLCDKYPNRFIDVDEVRLKCKYFVPENISRAELESTKFERPFKLRANYDEYTKKTFERLDEYVKKGKTLIASPHTEAFEYFVSRNIPFAFVYQKDDIKDEIIRRMKQRGNPQIMIDEIIKMFDLYCKMNKEENRSVIHYVFGKDEYLEDIMKKFGCEF